MSSAGHQGFFAHKQRPDLSLSVHSPRSYLDEGHVPGDHSPELLGCVHVPNVGLGEGEQGAAAPLLGPCLSLVSRSGKFPRKGNQGWGLQGKGTRKNLQLYSWMRAGRDPLGQTPLSLSV